MITHKIILKMCIPKWFLSIVFIQTRALHCSCMETNIDIDKKSPIAPQGSIKWKMNFLVSVIPEDR